MIIDSLTKYLNKHKFDFSYLNQPNEEMPEWIYDKRALQHSPSTRDGMEYATECKHRKEAARFINDVGAFLNLKHDTVATACVYFHRFFMCHSFKDFDRYVAALCCLFLAGKVEETPKKCRDMIRAARQRLSDEQFSGFGEDPREELMTLERVLLQTIKFDLQVEHPYQYLLKYAKVLKGDPEGIQKLVQMAWTFINDSFCTTLCLQWEPEVIAIALIFLASRLSKFEIEDWHGKPIGKPGAKWWDQFVEDMTVDVLEEICHQALDLYSSTKEGVLQQKKSSSDQRGLSHTTPSGSTPSPGTSSTGGSTNTPNTAGVNAGSSRISSHSQPSLPPAPMLQPGQMAIQHSFTVPPPVPAGQTAYSYAVPIQPQLPPGRGPAPPMPYGGGVFAYNYAVPPPPGAPGTGPPAYAVPAGYGHQGQVGPPGSQPVQAYGVPASVPHPYAMGMPPPLPGAPMGHPHTGYGEPPPPGQHQMPHQHHQRRTR